MEANNTTRSVLAGAYRGGRLSLKNLLTHTATATDSERAVCGQRNLTDEYSDPAGNNLPPTCPKCAAKGRR